MRLERLATLPLSEKPPIVVCLEAPDTNICMLWGAQFVTLSFAQPTPEDRNVLSFARDIPLGLLPATVVLHPEWLTLADVAVPQATEMEALLARLAPGHPRLPPRYPKDRQGLHTPGIPGPVVPSSPADGLHFPVAGERVAYDAHKIRRHGDDPVGGTIP